MSGEKLVVIYKEGFDRWFAGDRYLRALVRPLVGRKPLYASGMQTVVANFRLGLERRGIPYAFNPWRVREDGSPVICFGLGVKALGGVPRSRPVIAAVGFPFPAEAPTLCDDYTIRRYLQHSRWVLDVALGFGLYDPAIFALWPAGVDEAAWQPSPSGRKDLDVLVYRKLVWDRERQEAELLAPIRAFLSYGGYTTAEITYGQYDTATYRALLARARALLFLSAHESQGLAYQEAMACDVPVIAWNPGRWLDPVRFEYGRPEVPASSVPYFDARCGATFATPEEFRAAFPGFLESARVGRFRPREYVLENLSIERSTARMLDFLREPA